MSTRYREPQDGQFPDGNRGISEVVGFILSFSVIILAVGLLSTAGLGSLHDLQNNQETDNARGVLLAMSEGFSELQEGQAPLRAGVIDLQGNAHLAIANTSNVTIAVNGPGYSETFPMRSFEYRSGRTTLSYENGGVFRSDGEASVMIAEPPELYCSNASSVAVVPVITIEAPTSPSVSGGTVTVTGIHRSTTLLYPDDRTPSSINNVTISVDSPNGDAWNDYFSAVDTDWVDPDGDQTFACENVDRAFVRQTVIEIRIVA